MGSLHTLKQVRWTSALYPGLTGAMCDVAHHTLLILLAIKSGHALHAFLIIVRLIRMLVVDANVTKLGDAALHASVSRLLASAL